MKSHSNMPKYTHKCRPVIVAETWEILGHPTQPYRRGENHCNLCLSEKTWIARDTGEDLLNKMTEVANRCFHKEKHKLKNFNFTHLSKLTKVKGLIKSKMAASKKHQSSLLPHLHLLHDFPFLPHHHLAEPWTRLNYNNWESSMETFYKHLSSLPLYLPLLSNHNLVGLLTMLSNKMVEECPPHHWQD